MNPEQITQIIETIKTLNLNIDSVSAVQIAETIKPVLWMLALKPYFTAVIVAMTILISTIIVCSLIKKVIEQDNNEKKAKEVEKFLEELKGWDSVITVKEMLQEILEYMPRNKKKRKYN